MKHTVTKLDPSKMTREQLLVLGSHNALYNAAHMFEMASHKTLAIVEKKVLMRVAHTLMRQAIELGKELAVAMKAEGHVTQIGEQIVSEGTETKQ